MARSFTDPASNKLFVSRIASPEVVSFVRSRRGGADYALHDTKLLEAPAPGLVGDLIHEICHVWCFDSFVGQAMAFIDIRQRLLARLLPQASLEATEVLRDLCVKSLMNPLAEGMALFTEFDVWRSEHFGKTRTPIAVLDMFFSQGNLKDDHGGFLMDRMLEDQRDRPAFIRRKVDLYLNRFEVGQGYVPGYIAVKNIAFRLALAFPEVKQETLLRFLRDYFWNDPKLARLILAGPDLESTNDGPVSREQLDVMSARISKQDAIAVRREHFRRSRGSSAGFDWRPILQRLTDRMNALVADRSLGGKLGSIQARLEHGVGGVPTWEIGIDDDDIERFQAAELEMRSYALHFLDNHPFAEETGVKPLAAPLLLGLPELRRAAPLLSLYLKLDEDPNVPVMCATTDASMMFEVSASLFANLAPGTYTYFLLTGSANLEFREMILDQDFQPVQDPVLRTFLADVGIADDDIVFYSRLLLIHSQLNATSEEYARLTAAAASGTDHAHQAEDAAMNFYLQLATMFIDRAEARDEIKAALTAEGLKAFLPTKLSLIELAAQVSLLGNAASSLEEFAMYIALRSKGEFDATKFMSAVEEIFVADKHQFIFGRHKDQIVRCL